MVCELIKIANVSFCLTGRNQFQSTQVVGWKLIYYHQSFFLDTHHIAAQFFINPGLFLFPFRKKFRPSQTPLLCHPGRYERWDWVVRFFRQIVQLNNGQANMYSVLHDILTVASQRPQFHVALQGRGKLCTRYALVEPFWIAFCLQFFCVSQQIFDLLIEALANWNLICLGVL